MSAGEWGGGTHVQSPAVTPPPQSSLCLLGGHLISKEWALLGQQGVTGRGAWGAMFLHTGNWEAKVPEILLLAICLLEASLKR